MKSNDRFLLGIVAAIVLLVIVAFVVALNRAEPTYREDDAPEAVVHNYLLALQRQDFERAYGYLSPAIEQYPETLTLFEDDIRESPWNFSIDDSTTLEVLSARVRDERATVTVRRTDFYQSGLFNSNQSANTFEVELVRTAGAWRISDAGMFWWPCWSSNERCPRSK